jgi:polyhydroxybutyrate depolymerase
MPRWILLLAPTALCVTVASADVAPPASAREFEISFAGTSRWVTVVKPDALAPNAPAVVLLHGGTQSMRKIFSDHAGGMRQWLTVAEREKILLLIPNATNAKTGDAKGDNQNWNDLRGAGTTGKTSADDVGFILHLLKWAQEKYRHDPNRVFVTGASNGGMMTFRLLIEAPQAFSAAAAFISSLPATAPAKPVNTKRVPLLLLNGTRDPLIQWEGGEIKGARGKTMAIEPMVQWWRETNGVNQAPAVTETWPDTDPNDGCRLHHSAWQAQAPGAASVEFFRAEGGGHSLPSIAHPLRIGFAVRKLIGPTCREAEGAELAWAFFKKHDAAAR